jgi:hypothetical protein
MKAIGVVETVESAVEAIDPGIRPPNRFALVIGVADYQDARITDLAACERDARDLAGILTDTAIGLFPAANVTTLLNDAVTRTSVVAAMDELARKAGPDDLVVVFFSGHGATDEKGRAYWVMSDTKVDRLRATAMPELEITELLGEIKTKRLVTVIDACYSASTANVSSTKSLLDLSRLYPDFKGDGRVGMTASKGDQLSMVINDQQDPGFGHSAFTYHVIEGLRGNADARGNGDGVIELDELWSYVKDRTIETARRQGGNQEPQLKGQVGSRFMLAIDGERLKSLAESRKNASSRSDSQLEALRRMFVDEQISAAQFEDARTLLRTPIASLAETDRQRREVYADLAEGRIGPKHLATLLGSVQGRTTPVAPVAPAATPATEPAATPAATPAPDALPIQSAAWSEIITSIAPRFTDLEAPVAFAFDLDALRENAEFARFATAIAAWGAPEWANERGGLPRQAVLFGEPLPATSDSSLVLTGAVRQHRGEVPFGDLFESSIITDLGAARVGHDAGYTTMLAPRSTLSLVGESEAIDRLLARPRDGRPTWTAALGSVIRSAMPLGIVADGPWFLEHLERWAGPKNGFIFAGKIYEELSLPNSSQQPLMWTEGTEGIQTVSLTGQPTGSWIRTAVRIDFGTADEADRAAPSWRLFASRLPEWSGDAVRPLDVQVTDRSLIVRIDIRSAELLRWVDERCALPGSAIARPSEQP